VPPRWQCGCSLFGVFFLFWSFPHIRPGGRPPRDTCGSISSDTRFHDSDILDPVAKLSPFFFFPFFFVFWWVPFSSPASAIFPRCKQRWLLVVTYAFPPSCFFCFPTLFLVCSMLIPDHLWAVPGIARVFSGTAAIDFFWLVFPSNLFLFFEFSLLTVFGY